MRGVQAFIAEGTAISVNGVPAAGALFRSRNFVRMLPVAASFRCWRSSLWDANIHPDVLCISK
jgi:hypothetical protein